MTDPDDSSPRDADAGEDSGAYQPTGSYLLDHGVCAACGKAIRSVLDIAGQCAVPGCPKQICEACWNPRGRRRCAEHESTAD